MRFAIDSRCLMQAVLQSIGHSCRCSTLPFPPSRNLLCDGLQEQQEEAVQRRDHAEARQWRKRLHHYLDRLFRADQTAAADFADLQVSRCTITLDSCSQVCSCRQLYRSAGGQLQLTLRGGFTCKLAAFTALLLCILQPGWRPACCVFSDRLSFAGTLIAGYLFAAPCHLQPAASACRWRCLQSALAQSCLGPSLLQVELFAEFEAKRLMQFLVSSQSYSLESAYEICTARGLVSEQVFILGRMGNATKALHLIIEQLNNIPQVGARCGTPRCEVA